jgi:hypothetical protein
MNEAEWKRDPISGFLLQDATINGRRMVVIRSALGTRQWESLASSVRRNFVQPPVVNRTASRNV